MSYDAKRDVERIEKEETTSQAQDSKQYHDNRKNKVSSKTNSLRIDALEKLYPELIKRARNKSALSSSMDSGAQLSQIQGELSKLKREMSALSSSIDSNMQLSQIQGEMLRLKREMSALSCSIDGKLSEALNVSKMSFAQARRSKRSAASKGASNAHDIMSVGYIASGNVYLNGDDAYGVSANILNSTEDGYVELKLKVLLQANTGTDADPIWVNHSPWGYGLEPDIITSKGDVASGPVGAPEYELEGDGYAVPYFNKNGELNLIIKPDIDAGATKVYVDGEYMTVTIDFSSITTPIDFSGVSSLILDIPILE